MWCAKCQSEVAVEARPNSQRLHCATCGTEISPRPNRTGSVPPQGQAPSGMQPPSGGHAGTTPPAPKNPHELLARWAGNQMFDPYGPIISPEGKKEPPPESPQQPAKPASKSPAPSDQSAKIRIDPAFTEGWSEIPAPHTPAPSRSSHSRSRPRVPKLTEREMPAGQRAHSPSRLQGPHFDPARMRPPVNQSNWIAWFGQTLAYVGAGTLTVGAAMVMIGYMGGPTHYAPTGWFTTTIGQMLLFLGVVTLVSAGMEQTTVEVAKRIDTLGDQIERLEYNSHAHAVATEAEVEAELRAEIAQLRQQLSDQRRGDM